MLRSVNYLILFFWCFLFMTNPINAQDIEPELPDYLKTTTTTTSTTTTTTTTTTEMPPEITTQPPPPPTPTPADTTTTNLPSTNFIQTTTPIYQDTITTSHPMAQTPTPTIPTWIPPPTASHKPHYPHYPHHWGNRCYYKKQRGMAYLKWFCGQLRWVYSVDCFHCCYYDYSSFAGCSKVSHHNCAHYVD